MILGLTGGIGSGKSVVARIFATLGCVVFDSDLSAKEVYFVPGVKDKVTGLLGNESYLSDTEINKKHISTKIFGNAHLIAELNKIIHPAVSDLFKVFVAANQGEIIVKESALLFEANVTGQVNKIISVAADDEIRIKRVMTRDKVSRGEVMLRIENQIPQAEKIRKSDFVIYNNEREFVTPQVLDILKKIQHA